MRWPGRWMWHLCSRTYSPNRTGFYSNWTREGRVLGKPSKHVWEMFTWDEFVWNLSNPNANLTAASNKSCIPHWKWVTCKKENLSNLINFFSWLQMYSCQTKNDLKCACCSSKNAKEQRNISDADLKVLISKLSYPVLYVCSSLWRTWSGFCNRIKRSKGPNGELFSEFRATSAHVHWMIEIPWPWFLESIQKTRVFGLLDVNLDRPRLRITLFLTFLNTI